VEGGEVKNVFIPMVENIRPLQNEYNLQQTYFLTRKRTGFYALKPGNRVRMGDVKRVLFHGNTVELYVKAKPSEYKQRAGGWLRPSYESYEDWKLRVLEKSQDSLSQNG